MLRKRKLKKLYNVTHFYTDADARFEFYYRRNWLDQFDIMVYDITNNTNRWFMITAPVLFTMISVVETGLVATYSKNVDTSTKHNIVLDLIRKNDYRLVSHRTSKLTADAVLAKIGVFGAEDNKSSVLLLKRVVSAPSMNDLVFGMDTMEIPTDGVIKFIKTIKKNHFKGVELKMDTEE